MRGHILRRTANGLVARIEDGRAKGIKLKAEKGLNFPGVDLGLYPLTERDSADLDFITRHADMVGYSFVETAADVTKLQKELAARREDWRSLALVAKIETPRAVHNPPEIIVAAAGRQPLAIMIARGDFAIELGFERLAEMQEGILWLCEAAHVPAIWATQVLEGLVTKGLPSRGEMTDAAMAARAECIMLKRTQCRCRSVCAGPPLAPHGRTSTQKDAYLACVAFVGGLIRCKKNLPCGCRLRGQKPISPSRLRCSSGAPTSSRPSSLLIPRPIDEAIHKSTGYRPSEP